MTDDPRSMVLEPANGAAPSATDASAPVQTRSRDHGLAGYVKKPCQLEMLRKTLGEIFA